MRGSSYDPRINNRFDDSNGNGVTNHGYYQDMVDEGIKPEKVTARMPASLEVARPLYQQEELNEQMQYSVPERKVAREALDNLKGWSAKRCVKSVFPVLDWLPKYAWKRDIVSDLISGFTVGVMHIPQGMGYALLANVPPIVGIYMAFFPVMLYFLLGTSRHNSMGTFSVITIMCGKLVIKYSNDEIDAMQVGTAICFIVGVMQLIMYLGRLGAVSYLLSDTLVSGFTTGAAIHVLTAQMKELLGLTLPHHGGLFEIMNTYISIFERILNVNWVVISISAITIAILVLNNEYLKPIVAKWTRVPIPIQLIAVIVWTLLSKYMDLEGTFSVKPVGHIPKGFPEPKMPDTSLMPSLLFDSFAIAMVSYAVTVSMALTFAQKENYEVNFNQELLAMGASNILGSFFTCLPLCASLSRSMVQYITGGKTQIVSIVSCAILSVVLLWVGPFFEPLPRCVLSAIIVVALKGLFMQFADFKQFLKLSIVDAVVWMGTFLAVVFISIDLGLLTGMILSLISIFLRSMKPYSCLMENVPNTDLYLDVNRYKGTIDIPKVKIFHFCGCLNFVTKAGFKSSLCEALNINLTKQLRKSKKKDYKPQFTFEYLVLDFTALSSIDPSAVASLKGLIMDFGKLSVKTLVAGAPVTVYEMMTRCQLIDAEDRDTCKIFPTVHDAVTWAKEAPAKETVHPCDKERQHA